MGGRREKRKAEITWLRYFSISQLREGLRGGGRTAQRERGLRERERDRQSE